MAPANCEYPERCLNGCGYTVGSRLYHVYGDMQISQPATCTVEGTGVYTCQRLGCGDWYEVKLSKEHVPDHPATCTEDSICTNCEEVLQAASGHDWEGGDCITPPICSNCGEPGDGPIVGAHNWQWVTYDSYIDCSYRVSLEDQQCTICGSWAGVDRSYEVLVGHDWTAVCYEIVPGYPWTEKFYDLQCEICGEWKGEPWIEYEWTVD